MTAIASTLSSSLPPLVRSKPSPGVNSRAPGLYFDGFVAPILGVRPLAAGPAAVRVVTVPSTPEYDFLQAVFAATNLPIADYRPTALLRRLPACLRFLRVKTVAEATQKIAARPAFSWSVLDVILLGVSEFCRDQPVFHQLRRTVLPQICRDHARPRIWSAACSEGQELYSIGAFLAESEALERCELVGTDCRPEAIARAREGDYPPGAALQLHASWRRSLFFPVPNRGRIHPRLRTATCWRVGNVLDAIEPGPWHLILCRNLAIYLEPATAMRLWRRLADAVAPGGYLVTGKAEIPTSSLPFARVDSCIYRKCLE